MFAGASKFSGRAGGQMSASLIWQERTQSQPVRNSENKFGFTGLIYIISIIGEWDTQQFNTIFNVDHVDILLG